MTGDTGQDHAELGFEHDVRPLFREKDRNAMLRHFDLWSYDDVRAHQDPILAKLRAGEMPCDGAWPPGNISIFEGWVAAGSAP
jgi:hypothetical protein